MTTKPRASKKATVVQEPSLHEQLHAAMEGLDIPSPRRLMIGAVARLLAFGASAYATFSLVAYAMLGSVMFTGLGFITFMIGFIGYVIALIISNNIGCFVENLITTNNVAEKFSAARDSVATKFSELKLRFAS